MIGCYLVAITRIHPLYLSPLTHTYATHTHTHTYTYPYLLEYIKQAQSLSQYSLSPASVREATDEFVY